MSTPKSSAMKQRGAADSPDGAEYALVDPENPEVNLTPNGRLTIRLKKVSMPLGEVSVSSAMAEDNAREKAPTTKKKQPPPIAAFFAMDLNKSPSSENTKENAAALGKRLTKSASTRSAPATPAEGEDDYMLIPTGVKDTGLTGKYWADLAELPARRRSSSSKSKPSTPVVKSSKATPVVKSSAGSPRSTSRTATPARGDEGNLARQVAEKLLRQMKRRDDDDDDFVKTPAKTTKVKSAKSSRRQSSFAPSPAITPIAEEAVWSAPKKDTSLTSSTTRSGRKVTKRQSYVLSPPTTAASNDGKKSAANVGGKSKRKNQLTMEDLEDDDDVADGHFRPPKGGESSSSEEDEEDEGEELEESETPPKRNKRGSARHSTATPVGKGRGRGRATPGTPRTPILSRSNTPRRRPLMTPSVQRRKTPLSGAVSPLQEAQARLHVSAVPDSLPCREDEFAEVLSFTESKLSEGTGGCMYISGVPGTGKTATVMEVIRTLKEHADEGELPQFDFIDINGMRLTEPNQAYVQIWKKLTGQKATADHASSLLERRFSRASDRTTVLLVDELDMLWNRKQSVLYNLFEWPTRRESRLVVLAIANTMDLPERIMMNRVSSRLGLTRLTFSPYTHDQLKEIVAARLSGLRVFDGDAVQLVARKVASLSGDARRALDICRRATEIAQRERSDALVGTAHVIEAHNEMFCSPKILGIRSCSRHEQFFLRAVVHAFQKTGLEETSFDRVFDVVAELATVEGAAKIHASQGYDICFSLAANRLILAEHGKLGPQLRIRLNVSQDDVLFALDSRNNG